MNVKVALPREAAVVFGASLLLATVLGACGDGRQQDGASMQEDAKQEAEPMTSEKMILTSAAFGHEERIPVAYTCDGEDLSPPLKWEGAPENTQAFAMICDDPDAPVGTWDHWVLFNIHADKKELPAGMPDDAKLEDGSLSGLNSWKRTGYGGPCPPPGKPHRYYFRIYALSAPVDLPERATKAELLQAMEKLILASGTLMGTYGR